jgi:hypothetical protein
MKTSLLIKLHLYTGIFISFYILAFGVSSIILNHDLKVERSEVTKIWETNVSVDPSMPELQLAENIRNELNLMGWLLPWEFKRDSAQFKFSMVHPGRKYHLSYDILNGMVKIEEMPRGFLVVFHGLHFLNGKPPNAPFLIKSWVVYQWVGLLSMFISLILGIWLWLKNHYKPWQGIVFGSLFVGTLIIMYLL